MCPDCFVLGVEITGKQEMADEVFALMTSTAKKKPKLVTHIMPFEDWQKLIFPLNQQLRNGEHNSVLERCRASSSFSVRALMRAREIISDSIEQYCQRVTARYGAGERKVQLTAIGLVVLHTYISHYTIFARQSIVTTDSKVAAMIYREVNCFKSRQPLKPHELVKVHLFQCLELTVQTRLNDRWIEAENALRTVMLKVGRYKE